MRRWGLLRSRGGAGLMGVTGEEVELVEVQGRGRVDGCDW